MNNKNFHKTLKHFYSSTIHCVSQTVFFFIRDFITSISRQPEILKIMNFRVILKYTTLNNSVLTVELFLSNFVCILYISSDNINKIYVLIPNENFKRLFSGFFLIFWVSLHLKCILSSILLFL